MPVQLLADAAGSYRALLDDPALISGWDQPSVLNGYSVGGVASHVRIAVGWTELAMRTPFPEGRVLSLGEWFQGMLPTAAADDGVHESIREQAQSLAKRGPHELAVSFDRMLQRLLSALRESPPGRRISLEPVRAGGMLLTDFVRTRLLELIVHTDDLAQSVGLEPALPAAAVADCLDLLLEVARFRHADIGVLRALTRAERAPAAVFPVI